MTKIRTGQAPAPLTRVQFGERFNRRFVDPAYEAERDAIARLGPLRGMPRRKGARRPLHVPQVVALPTPKREGYGRGQAP